MLQKYLSRLHAAPFCVQSIWKVFQAGIWTTEVLIAMLKPETRINLDRQLP